MKTTLWLPANVSVFGPWFPRGGDYLEATAEVVKNVGSINFQVQVYTKAHDDAGDGTRAGSLYDERILFSGTTGRVTAEWGPDDSPGLDDLVRYWFNAGESATAGAGIEFRMLMPVWFDTTVPNLSWNPPA